MEKAIKRYFPIFVLPTMIAFTLGFIIPFVEGVYLSFCKFTTVNDAKFIGFANYAKVFADETFVHAFWYTAAFLTLTNSFKLFDQNLALTNGEPSKMSEMLALNIFNTFYGRTGYEGVGQAKAVIFFILVTVIALTQNYLTRRKEVQQ